MKRLDLKSAVLALSMLMIISSCSKIEVEPVTPGPGDPEVPTDPPTTPTPKPLTFFYAGYKYNADFKTADRNAILSINDSLINLSPNTRSDALAIAAVNNKEAHVTGYQMAAGGKKRVAYWKNNRITYLTDAGNFNSGTSINVIGSKVYVGGTKDHSGYYGLFLWTNGVESRKACCLASSTLTSITESNGKPVLAGRFNSNAHMFKDGYAIALAGPNTYADYVHAIGSDIYVIGKENFAKDGDAAMVWKNDVQVFKMLLGRSATDVIGTMAGQDYYYVANFYSNNKGTSVVYKNRTRLYQLNPNQSLAATAIQVVAGKVYVLGNYLNGTKSTAVLWTNGQPKVLFAESKKIYLNDFVINNK